MIRVWRAVLIAVILILALAASGRRWYGGDLPRPGPLGARGGHVADSAGGMFPAKRVVLVGRLRRAAIGVLRILMRFKLPLDGSSQALYRRHYNVSKDSRRFLVDTALEELLRETR